MAVHHGKEGEVVVGGTAVGELVSFTLETTGDVVESTKMSDSAKSFIACRTSFSEIMPIISLVFLSTIVPEILPVVWDKVKDNMKIRAENLNICILGLMNREIAVF